jgi:DNA repair exonuclease SbcCD nuclease subunit
MSDIAIVFSDPHIYKYKQFNEGNRRLKNGIALLDYIFKLADTNKIKTIIMPGDLYNLMQIMSTETEDAVIKCLARNFEEYPEIYLVAISGNHDFANKNLIDAPAVSALEHLAVVFDHFVLLDGKESVYFTDHKNVIVGVPYYEYPEHFRQALAEKELPEEGPRVFLLMHQVVASGLPIEDHIEANDLLLTGYDMVFNGHLHTGKEVTDRFINVGAPMHRDNGDVGTRKGIWLVDLDEPVETLSFKDITDMFPQFIYKEEMDDGLTEWESKQFITWIPAPTASTVEDKQLAEQFRTDLSPATIMQNYCHAIEAEQDITEYGLTLLV